MKKLLSLIICATLLFACVSCAPRQKKYTAECFDYFDTYARLTVYTDSASDFENYKKIFEDTLAKYHRLLDAFEEYEDTVNICTLNKSAGEGLSVSAELFDFLTVSKKFDTLTHGYVTPTVGALSFVWKDAIKTERVPDKDKLLDAAEHISTETLLLESEGNFVTLTDTAARLDAGAFGKGYVADIIAANLRAAGAKSFLLDIGGTLYAEGDKPENTPFIAAVDRTEITLPLDSRAISTSGSYHRGFEADGVRYHHIISPKSLYPENTFVSVSVIAPHGVTADALSTALFCMSLEAGKELISTLEDTDAVWVYADGQVVSTMVGRGGVSPPVKE